MTKKIGRQTYKLNKPISITAVNSSVGPKESEGPLKEYFDKIYIDDTLGQNSYEKAEHILCYNNLIDLLKKSGIKKEDVDIYIGGDLLNQLSITNLTARDIGIPFWGIYNACSTFSLGMQIAATLLDGDFITKGIISATSHFSTAERQYRFPLELGVQPPITSQRTVTGSGAVYLTKENTPPFITYMTIGKVMDYGRKDPNDMGSAMSIAAYHTIIAHFEDTGLSESDYDMILTGDLGKYGHDILRDLLIEKGINIQDKLNDCGLLVYDRNTQDVNCGGSGAGCCASVFTSYIYKLLKEKKLNKILFLPTGALLSQTSAMQKEDIPCVSHALTIENYPSL